MKSIASVGIMTDRDRALFSSRGFLLVILGIAIPLVWLHLSQFTKAGYSYPISPEAKGADLSGIIDAAWTVSHGGSPYGGETSFPKSPLNVLLYVPLTYLPNFDLINTVYHWLTLIVVFGAIAVMAWWSSFGFWAAFAVSAITLFTYPFQLHFERGQMDAFSIATALGACICASRGRLRWAYFLAVVAVQLKPNALVLISPFLIATSIKTTLKNVATFLGLLAVSFLITPNLSLAFFIDLSHRSKWLISGNNGSVYRFFCLLPFGELMAALFLIVVGVVLTLGIAKIHEKDARAAILIGFFWMLPIFTAYPPTNFIYCYVFMASLVFAFCLDDDLLPRSIRKIRWMACFGLVLALFPAGNLTARYAVTDWFVIPPIGTILMILANLFIAFRELTPITKSLPSTVSK